MPQRVIYAIEATGYGLAIIWAILFQPSALLLLTALGLVLLARDLEAQKAKPR
jgi:ABC-type dipeptide/oligopeptide/nickel transport system permease subunit